MKNRVQIGVSTMRLQGDTVPSRMLLSGHNAFFIDQCSRDAEESISFSGESFPVYKSAQKGLARSRNLALSKANRQFLWLCDDDVRIDPEAEARIVSSFEKHPQADALCFNVVSDTPDRPQRLITQEHTLQISNAMRYPTYRFVYRTESLRKSGVRFDERFGSGAVYTSGEDSLFTCACLRKGLKIIAVPVEIGHVDHADSGWFSGYTDKFLFDKGALFAAMFGFALPYCLLMLLKHPEWRDGRPLPKALWIMLRGARAFKKSK